MPDTVLPTCSELAERLPLGVCFFDDAGFLTFANGMAGRLFGRELAQGAHIDLLVDGLGAGCAGLRQLAPGGRMVVVAGGKLLEVEAQESRSGSLWLITDTSVQLRLHSQLAENSGLLAYSHEAFLIVDAQGFIRYANQVCERERGWPQHAMVGMNLAGFERWCGSDYQHVRTPTNEDIVARLQGAARDSGVLRYNAWHTREDGTEMPVEVTCRPYRMSNETVLMVTARDDSRRLMHLQALVNAKAEAEAANRAKSAFLAITSHELRTPLTGIIGFCELLQLELAPDSLGQRTPAPGALLDAASALRYLKLIAESSQSLLTIINDVVDLSKIEARTLEIRLGTVDPEQLIDQQFKLWRERAVAKHLHLERRPSTGTPPPPRQGRGRNQGPSAGHMISDAQRLRQMLDNLLSNAVKFTERGSIALGLDHQDDWVEFSVADTGCGIAPEAATHIFEAFWQAGEHTTRAVGGNGLGLYITRCLAEMLGGRIWLQRTGPDGSEFRLRLPRQSTGPDSGHGRLMKSDVWLGGKPR